MIGRDYVRQTPTIHNQKTFQYRHMCNMLFVAWQIEGVPPHFHPDERFKYDRGAVAQYLIDNFDDDRLDRIHARTEIDFPVRKGRPANSLARKTLAKLGDSVAPTEYNEYLFGPVPPPPPPPRQIPTPAEHAETIAFETPQTKERVAPFSVYTEMESKKAWAEDAQVIDNELEIGDDSVYITRKEMKGILTELTQSLNRVLRALDVGDEQA